MPRRDFLHGPAKQALENDGWLITHDPYTLPFGATIVEIDLGAERLIAAEKGTEKIAVEIKSFVAASVLSEFHTALGQYLNYRVTLHAADADRILYLAVPQDAFESFFQQVIVKRVLEEYDVKLLVFDPQDEQIRQWIN